MRAPVSYQKTKNVFGSPSRHWSGVAGSTPTESVWASRCARSSAKTLMETLPCSVTVKVAPHLSSDSRSNTVTSARIASKAHPRTTVSVCLDRLASRRQTPRKSSQMADVSHPQIKASSRRSQTRKTSTIWVWASDARPCNRILPPTHKLSWIRGPNRKMSCLSNFQWHVPKKIFRVSMRWWVLNLL